MNSFKQVIKVSIHVRSSNDQINWSNWEDAGNGLSLKITPSGRYLQVEAVLEIIKGLNSPVVYDISVNALNTTSGATDLAVNITGNASSVGMGDTVHLVIGLSNLGPNPSNASLVYKIPVGLKLLSSQGPGVYDAVSGVWNAGVLLVNGSVVLDLVLQAVNVGYFVNVVSVYGDLTSTHAHAAIPIVKVFNGKWRSTAAMGDSNTGNNWASYSFDVRSPDGPGSSFDYKWPDDVPPAPQPDPKPDPDPQPDPDPKPKPKPPWDPQPSISNNQLPKDIRSVRDVVSGVEGAKIADWTGDPGPELTQEEYEDWAGTTIKLAGEVLFLVGIEIASKPLGSAGEYLSGIAGQYIKVPQAVGMIAKWFGNSRYKTIVNQALKDVNRAIKGTWAEKVVNGIDTAIQTVGFNYGMEVFKTLLLKLFPDKGEKISLALKMIGYGEFVSDPIGTTMAFIDVVVSFLFEGDLPDRGNFEKVFIFKPLQDPNA